MPTMAAAAQNPQINTESNSDVFSMTDDGLARRFQFQKEVIDRSIPLADAFTEANYRSINYSMV